MEEIKNAIQVKYTKVNNVIYVNDDFYGLSIDKQRLKIIKVGLSKFKSLDKAEAWLDIDHHVLGNRPEFLLGTYKGYCLVLDAIIKEKQDWEI